jgi:hypothetical protein
LERRAAVLLPPRFDVPIAAAVVVVFLLGKAAGVVATGGVVAGGSGCGGRGGRGGDSDLGAFLGRDAKPFLALLLLLLLWP